VKSYRLTPRAADGLWRILVYVEDRFSAAATDRVLAEIESAFDLLVERPHIGHRREELTSDPRIRFWSVGPTLIAYRASDDAIEVLFVERGSMDWERLMDELPRQSQ
jgi:plasmid stabilization system protein ParE